MSFFLSFGHLVRVFPIRHILSILSSICLNLTNKCKPYFCLYIGQNRFKYSINLCECISNLDSLLFEITSKTHINLLINFWP